MASANQDALLLFRACIASKTPPIPTTSSDPSSTADYAELPAATHVLFNSHSSTDGPSHIALPCSTPTRFISTSTTSSSKAEETSDNSTASAGGLDLLSVFWCWQNKDKGVGEYIAATQALNSARQEATLSPVTNLVFAEKLDLVNWLAGDVGEAESEFIRPLGDTEETRRLAGEAAELAKGGEAGDVPMGGVERDGGDGDKADRMRVIYRQERILGDRNTVLRGIKQTDFSHVRKYTALFLSRSGSKSAPAPALTPALRAPPSSKGSSRKPEPIILLSPSASSLLRLSNIKSFLVDGLYTPPSSAATVTNMAQISRVLPSIDPLRPTRFILVESPENFKPDYWNRVVAVFTTGQSWQFKGYKWSHPAELFNRVLGVYVGWRNEGIPDVIRGWGRGVKAVGVEYWREGQGAGERDVGMRWRDREVVEEIWSAIEASMRAKGFGK
ncbi:hypothetical protein AAFC00_004469 [Neodothiora populina]|uniref:Cell division control protein 73 C-terminal domain-containing protein n=1 Tax=Neodothiora populina TaxID=2781224 RepID=A0ABR3P2F9_9PEZI